MPVHTRILIASLAVLLAVSIGVNIFLGDISRRQQAVLDTPRPDYEAIITVKTDSIAAYRDSLSVFRTREEARLAAEKAEAEARETAARRRAASAKTAAKTDEPAVINEPEAVETSHEMADIPQPAEIQGEEAE